MIELRDLIRVLFKSKTLLVVCSIVGVSLGWLNASVGKSFSSATVSLVRDGVIEKNAMSSYQYDGYYLVETLRLFGERLGNILRDSSSLRQLDGGSGNTSSIQHVERLNLSDYKIRVEGSKDSAQESRQALETSISGQLHMQAEATGEYANFKARISDFVQEPRVASWQQMIAGALLGLLAGILLVLFRHYMSESEPMRRKGDVL